MNNQKFRKQLNTKNLSTGFKSLDTALGQGFTNTDLIILSARPAMGKTALAHNIALNTVFKNNKTVAIFSLEMSKNQLIQRMLFSCAEIEIQRLKTGNMRPSDWEELAKSIKEFTKVPIYIDDTAGCTAQYISEKCHQLISSEDSLGLIVIDYLQLMEGNNEDILKQLKTLTTELKVPVLCLSQLSRKLEKRENKRPVLDDINDKCAIEEIVDIVLFLYRDDYYTPIQDSAKSEAEIIIAKNRQNPDISKIRLEFKKDIIKFNDIKNI